MICSDRAEIRRVEDDLLLVLAEKGIFIIIPLLILLRFESQKG